MLETVLHLGAHRCATTSFQTYLEQNASRLAMFDIAAWTPAQTRSAQFAGLVRPPEAETESNLQLEKAASRLIGAKRDALAARGVRNLIVSEENMIGTPRDNLARGALYPHLSVFDNMAFSLQIASRPKDEIKQKVEEVARILQLDQHLDRKPSQLSGGQRQRVAIGRAIVRQPKAFLFDEPLSNLDAELRVQMRMEIARLHNQIGATMIYVTHDQVEAMTLADKIVVLKSGTVQQIGSPLELYDNPDNQFVAGFIGSPRMNFLEGKVVQGGNDAPDEVRIELVEAPNSSVPVTLSGPKPVPGATVILGIRPENIETGNPVSAEDNAVELSLKTEFTEELGGVSYVHTLTEGGVRVTIERRSDRNHIAQDHISARLPTRHLFLFDANGMRLR